ncbi:MAG: hypothetical protein E7030_07115 [Akkermansiaceae bacterium]|nr:hypothetical protein [Akkermansiaceae bacterium]
MQNKYEPREGEIHYARRRILHEPLQAASSLRHQAFFTMRAGAFFMTSVSESIKGIYAEITRKFLIAYVFILAARVVKKPPTAACEECTCGA